MPSACTRCSIPCRLSGRYEVHHRLAVGRHESVQIDEVCELLGHTVGDAGDHGSAGAMPHKDHPAHVLILEDVHDILDVGLETDFGVSQVRPFAEPRERGRVNLVSPLPQQRGHLLPAPAAVPSGVNKNIRGLVGCCARASVPEIFTAAAVAPAAAAARMLRREIFACEVKPIVPPVIGRLAEAPGPALFLADRAYTSLLLFLAAASVAVKAAITVGRLVAWVLEECCNFA